MWEACRGTSIWVTKVLKFWCGSHTNLGTEVKLSESCVAQPCVPNLRPQGIPPWLLWLEHGKSFYCEINARHALLLLSLAMGVGCGSLTSHLMASIFPIPRAYTSVRDST